MNNLEDLSFNYNKSVNNFTNQEVLKHKLTPVSHKMKQARHRQFCKFYENFSELEINLANQITEVCFNDLEMYENWLGNNGITRY